MSTIKPNWETPSEDTRTSIRGTTRRARSLSYVPLIIGVAVVLLLFIGSKMISRAESKTNKVALASSPKPVGVILAKSSFYSPSVSLVGTIKPWIEANVGPQFISAYVQEVLVRPGAVVKKGQVLATLDCRDTSAATEAIRHQARALEARERALRSEAERTQGLLSGGYVSRNEAEQKLARSIAQTAEFEAQKAHLAKGNLAVSDCVLRAPFDGEIAERLADPGTFAHPNSALVTIVDRSTVRMTADAPESDFGVVSPGASVKVHVFSTGQDIAGTITRRAPSADPSTRTIHFEIDIPDPGWQTPVNTTGEVRIAAGGSVPATEIPVYATVTTGRKAALFTVEDGKAHARSLPLLGEVEGRLFFSPDKLKPGTPVVVEGRTLLANGDPVSMSQVASASSSGTVGTTKTDVSESTEGHTR